MFASIADAESPAFLMIDLRFCQSEWGRGLVNRNAPLIGCYTRQSPSNVYRAHYRRRFAIHRLFCEKGALFNTRSSSRAAASLLVRVSLGGKTPAPMIVSDRVRSATSFVMMLRRLFIVLSSRVIELLISCQGSFGFDRPRFYDLSPFLRTNISAGGLLHQRAVHQAICPSADPHGEVQIRVVDCHLDRPQTPVRKALGADDPARIDAASLVRVEQLVRCVRALDCGLEARDDASGGVRV